MKIHRLPNAAEVLELHVAIQQIGHISFARIRITDDPVWKTAPIGDGLQPLRFAYRILRIVANVEMHGFDQVLVLRILEKVFDQIVVNDGRVIPEGRRLGTVVQPGIVVVGDVPQMVMRVDQGNVVHRDAV